MKPPSVTATTDAIRDCFPALQREHNRYPVAYFDGPGGTQVPSIVADTMVNYLLHHNANTHWAFPSSQETDEILEQARMVFGEFLNCCPTEIVFGQNMTTLTFHVARSLGRLWKKGDEIIVTDLDHHANIDPWKDVARQHGYVICSVPFNPDTGQLNVSDFENLITARTQLIAIGAASNALGTINDVKSITSIAQNNGITTFVDGVAYAPHVLCDVHELGCDYFVCSPYKFYGPHAGVLYGKNQLLETLDSPRLQPASSSAPYRLETGTLSHEAIAGSAATVKFIASLSPGTSIRESLQLTFTSLHDRAQVLTTLLWEELQNINTITCYGPPPSEERVPTISFSIDGVGSEEVCRSLSNAGLFLSHGDFYASTVIEKLNVEGLVRVGLSCYSSTEEVERLIERVRQIASSN